MSLEEFDAWAESVNKHQEVRDAADEGGGARLSLVPIPDQQSAWPTSSRTRARGRANFANFRLRRRSQRSCAARALLAYL